MIINQQQLLEKIRLLKANGINYDIENLNLLLCYNNRSKQKLILAKDKYNEKDFILNILEQVNLVDNPLPSLGVFIKNLQQIVSKNTNKGDKSGNPIDNIIRICDTFINEIEQH